MQSKRNPYNGLEPYLVKDSHLFKGREHEIRGLLSNINDFPFLAVIGFSGSGKSSLVKAGLLNSIHGGYLAGASNGWQVAMFTPHDAPLKEMYNSLLTTKWGKENLTSEKISINDFVSEGLNLGLLFSLYPLGEQERLLLIVDQFEELFTYQNNLSKNYELSQKFINTLLTFATKPIDEDEKIPFYRVNVILTMRVDFLSKLVHFDKLSEAFSKNIYFIPKISNNKLKEVIEKPARIFGKKFESNLLDLLIRKCKEIEMLKMKMDHEPTESEEDDTLPLLQHFLMHLWNRFPEEKTFTINHYLQIGPIHRVLDKHLTEIYYFQLNNRERKLTEFLFSILSKRDSDNPRRIVRNSQTINIIANLYKQLNENENDINTLINEFIGISQKFCGKEVKALKVKNQTTGVSLTDESEIDVMHEAVFRNWELCRYWINKEAKTEDMLYELWNKDIEIDKYWSYDKIKHFLSYKKYFTNKLWLMCKGADSMFSVINNQQIRTLEKLRLKHAIKKGDFLELFKIINSNGKKTIQLTEEELKDKDFEEIFYYTLFPDELPNKSIQDAQKFFESSNKSKFNSKKENFRVLLESQKQPFVKFEVIDDDHKKHNISHFAAFVGNKDCYDLLKEFKAEDIFNLNKEDEPDIFGLAVYGGNFELAKEIYNSLESRQLEKVLYKETREHKRIPLHLAVMMGHTEIFEWLMRKHEDFRSTLREKYDTENLDDYGKKRLRKRIDYKNYSDILGDNILHLATFQDKIELVTHALDYGVKQELSNNHGRSPLHYACWLKSLNAIEKLLGNCQNETVLQDIVKHKDNDGSNILMFAIRDIPETFDKSKNSMKLQVLQTLLNYKETAEVINDQDANGWTVLFHAIKLEDIDIVLQLINNSARTDLMNNQEETSLHLAASLNTTAILKLLQDNARSKLKRPLYNEFINKRNKNNFGAAELAYSHGKFDNLNLLLRENAEFSIPVLFGEDYDPLEQKSVRWDDAKITKLFNSYEENHEWEQRPLVFSADKWSIETKEVATTRIRKYINQKKDYIKRIDIHSFISLRSCKLSFYSNSLLCEMKINQEEEHMESMIFIDHPQGITFLNGTPQPVLDLNSKIPLELNQNHVLDYFKFFNSLMQADEGRFRVIESSEDIEFDGDNIILECIPQKVSIIELDDRRWELETILHYSNVICYAKYTVDGRVKGIGNDKTINMDYSLPLATFSESFKDSFQRYKRKYERNASQEQVSLVFDKKINQIKFLVPFIDKLGAKPHLLPLWHNYTNKDGIGKLTQDKIESLVNKTIVGKVDSNWHSSLNGIKQWKYLDKEKAVEILLQIASNDDFPYTFDFDYFDAVRRTKLSFYNGSYLYEVRTVKNGYANGVFIFIIYSDKIVYLNGTSPPIHHLNKVLPIQLDNANVIEYLEFFCAMVHGKEGAFRIINSANSIRFLDNNEKNKAANFIQFVIKTYTTATLQKIEKSNEWEKRALINYSNALFLANFRIKTNGGIDMVNDIPIYSNLSVNVPIFNSNTLKWKVVKPMNDKDNFKKISFTQAAKLGLLKAMQWLKKYDSNFDINMVDENGNSALALAKENKHNKIVDWLLEQKGIKEE